jgi:hypothetical protein
MGWKETWHKTSPWHFAFEYICIDGKDYIYIQDAEHQDDIKESCYKTKYRIIENKKYNIINRVRLTKNQLHNIITESVKKILMESY